MYDTAVQSVQPSCPRPGSDRLHRRRVHTVTNRFDGLLLPSPHHTTSHQTTPHHTTPRRITSHHITPHHTTPQHSTSHHSVAQHSTSHHNTSHHTTHGLPPDWDSAQAWREVEVKPRLWLWHCVGTRAGPPSTCILRGHAAYVRLPSLVLVLVLAIILCLALTTSLKY